MEENSTQLYPAIYPETINAVKVTAGTTCILSLFGSSVIILTYVAFKDLRTISRQLLVNLSVADIIVALAHFVGLFANFERFLPNNYSNSSSDPLCIAQGAFTVYGTIASFLWSILIAIHLFVMIITRKKIVSKFLVPFFYIVSWGVPLIVVIIEGALRYLGFEPVSNAGWCYTQITHVSLTAQILGYEIWLMIAFVVVTVLYVILFCYIRCKIKFKKSDYWSLLGAAKGDIKLLLVPIIFFILRIWNQIIDGILHYSRHDEGTIEGFRHSVAAAVLVVFSGVGLNAQGISNAILFCGFTTQVRRRLLLSMTKFLRWCVYLVCRCKFCAPCGKLKRKLLGDEHFTVAPPSLGQNVLYSVTNDDSTALLEDSINAGAGGRPSSSILTYGTGSYQQQ